MKKIISIANIPVILGILCFIQYDLILLRDTAIFSSSFFLNPIIRVFMESFVENPIVLMLLFIACIASATFAILPLFRTKPGFKIFIRKPIYFFFLIFILITVGLHLLLFPLTKLDASYRQTHETELTSQTTITLNDGSIVTNNYYAITPYHYPILIVSFAEIVVPIILIFVFGMGYLNENINKKRFFQSLSFPILFGFIEMLFFYFTSDKSSGDVYDALKWFTVVEFGFIFFSLFAINLAILRNNQPIPFRK